MIQHSSSPLLTLETFLAQYPWSEAPRFSQKPMDYLWTFDLDASTEALWPILSNTSLLNKYMGIPKMKFVEKEGRLYGKSRNAGILLEWEEVPWEWEYAKELRSARLYHQGFLLYVRARYLLEPLNEKKTRLYIYFGWIPKGKLGRMLLPAGMKQLHASYQKMLAMVVKNIQQQTSVQDLPEVTISEEIRDKLTILEKELLAMNLNSTLVNKIFQWIPIASENELYRIRLRFLAQQWGCNEEELLLIFLYATQKGVFLLTWDILCPHCRGSRRKIYNLGDLPRSEKCEPCQTSFDATRIDSLEVTFRLHPSIREVEPTFYCSGEPAKKTHIKIQRRLAPQETLFLETRLPPGWYQMRLLGQKDAHCLSIRHQEPTTQEILWTFPSTSNSFQRAPAPQMYLKNESNTPQTFIVEDVSPDQIALRPFDLFNFQEFRDLFSEEAIASGLELDIGEQSILFTDIVGSTQFYEKEGDANAFAEVRKHFVIIYEQVKKHKGAIVKTIGDAAMATFRDPISALSCAIHLQQYFRSDNPETKLRLRITVNVGPCLAVNLNSNIDYFGSSINLTAKLQGITGAGEVVFTEAIYKLPSCEPLLAQFMLKPTKKNFTMSWAQKSIEVYSVQISS